MLLQWLITGVIVAACLAYAIRTLMPKAAQDAGGCGGGCSGCSASAQSCATPKADFQPMDFHPRRPG